MVSISGFHCCDLGSVPGQGTEVSQATQQNQKKKKKKLNSKGTCGQLFKFTFLFI